MAEDLPPPSQPSLHHHHSPPWGHLTTYPALLTGLPSTSPLQTGERGQDPGKGSQRGTFSRNMGTGLSPKGGRLAEGRGGHWRSDGDMRGADRRQTGTFLLSRPETKAVMSSFSKHFSFFAPYSHEETEVQRGLRLAHGHTATRDPSMAHLKHSSDFGEHSRHLGA